MKAHPAELRPYRIGVYLLFGLLCALLFFAIARSVVADLYGRGRSAKVRASPLSCLEDLDRLYGQLASRAVQPAPRGLDTGLLSREWERWSRGWQNELADVSTRCGLDDTGDPALVDLASAREGLEELRRGLAHSGEEASRDARRVKDSLSAAREKLLR